MDARFFFEGGEAFTEELILVAEGLDLVMEDRKGFSFCYDVM